VRGYRRRLYIGSARDGVDVAEVQVHGDTFRFSNEPLDLLQHVLWAKSEEHLPRVALDLQDDAPPGGLPGPRRRLTGEEPQRTQEWKDTETRPGRRTPPTVVAARA